jgi:PKD repeat protein/C1A family cysteine protease
MKRFLRIAVILGLAISLCLLSLPIPILAGGDEVHATGLNQPSAEQAEWMKKNFPVIQKVRLNSLAIERINIDRKGKGMAKLTAAQLELAPMGKEAVFATSGGTGTQTTSLSAAALPGSIDNSAAQAFPPIRSQGGLGSCVAWATTYYQFTYETNLALGRNAKAGDNTVIFSPKWTYNMINGGANNGAYFSDAYNLELKNGAASWSDFPYDTNYLAWDLDSSHWNKAISYRVQMSGSIYNSNVDTMIASLKTQLANGHIMVIGTYVNSWVQTRLGNDPSTAADDAFAGQYVASYESNTAQGAHGMTVVGYNDDLWCDLNGNGVVDTGEKGAFKIANSWGTGDWNGGYRWITYDSLRSTSGAPAFGTWPTSNRASGGIFFGGTVYTLSVSQSAYTPTMEAEVTLNQAKRGQVAVTLGIGPTSATTPAYTWTSKAVYNTGGNFAFNGTATACDGTFIFDFSDLTKYASGTNRWFVGVRDSTSGDITSISSFKLYQGNTLVAAASGLPRTADAALVYTWIDYAINSYNQLPSAVIVTDRTSGSAPLTVNFDGAGSTAPAGGSLTGYSWDFGDGTPADSGATASHTYAAPGTYSASLTVTDDKNATNSCSVVINVINQPPSAAFVALPTSGNYPLIVNFDASSSRDSDGSIVFYAWSFGDGNTASGVTASHTYNAAGTYTAKLTVTDNKGSTGSASSIISVIDPNILNAPTKLSAAASKGTVTLAWTDNSSNESGFYIERGVKSRNKITYTRIGTVGANVNTYVDAGVKSGTNYYRVQAFNAATGKTSNYSNTVSVQVK